MNDVIGSYSSLINSEKKSEEEIEREASKIASNLDQYINNESLKELNNYALSKILFNANRSKNVTESQIFRVIKDNDSRIELYTHINIGELDEKDKEYFLKSKRWPKLIESKYVLQLLSDIYEKSQKQYECIEKLEKKIKEDEEKYANVLGPLQSQVKDYIEWRHRKEEEYYILDSENRDFVTKYNKLLNEFEKLKNNYEELLKKQIENEKKKAIFLPFKGIIYDLKKANNDIKNCVEIIVPKEANNSLEKYYDPYNLFEYDDKRINDCYYHNINKTEKNNDNWIIFHFKNQKYKIYGFSIRTNTFGHTFSHPKNFKIQGSNNGRKWDKIYEVDDDKNQFLNGLCHYHTYIFDEVGNSYQFIRFLQTDTHFKYKDRFGIIALSAIEFFGREVND